MNKNLTRILSVMMCLVVMMSFSTIPVNAASKKPGKVKSSSIVYTGTDSTYSTMSFKWKKVKGAKGYQVRIINAKAYEDANFIEYYIAGNSKKNKITLNTASLQGDRMYRLQVRAYKKKCGRRVFGKWSTSKSRFAALIPMNPAPEPTPVTVQPDIDSRYNTTISVNNPNITINQGETVTLEVYTDKGTDINYDWDDSNIDFRLGDWFGTNDQNCSFYITGLNKGTSTVTIYDSHNTSVKVNVTVTVR